MYVRTPYCPSAAYYCMCGYPPGSFEPWGIDETAHRRSGPREMPCTAESVGNIVYKAARRITESISWVVDT